MPAGQPLRCERGYCRILTGQCLVWAPSQDLVTLLEVVALRTTSCSHLLQQGCAFLIDDTLPPSQVASEWPPCGVTGEIAICITSETDNSFRFVRQNWIAFGFYANQDLAPGTEAGSLKNYHKFEGQLEDCSPKGAGA